MISEFLFQLFKIHKRLFKEKAMQPSVGCLAFRQVWRKIAEPIPFFTIGKLKLVTAIKS